MKLITRPGLSKFPMTNKEFIFYFLDLLKTSKLEFLDIFEDPEYCYEIFALNYPLLVDITGISRFDLGEITIFSGKNRYYKYKKENIFYYDQKTYLVVNEWSDKNKKLFINWMINELENK